MNKSYLIRMCLMINLGLLLFQKSYQLEYEFNPTPSIYEELIYEELNLTEKSLFLIGRPIEKCDSPYKCLTVCNNKQLCSFAYFHQNTCYICNYLAENFISKRTSSDQIKILHKKISPLPLNFDNLAPNDIQSSTKLDSNANLERSTDFKQELLTMEQQETTFKETTLNSIINQPYSESTRTSSNTILTSQMPTFNSDYAFKFNISCLINSNFALTNGFQNYWPFNNGSLVDLIGGADLFGGQNFAFVPDRFKETNASLSLSNGYLQMPPGIYFNSDYTVMSWVFVKKFASYSRLIDLSNGTTNGYVAFILTYDSSGCPMNRFYLNTNLSEGLVSRISLKLNQWEHLTYVYRNPFLYIYINGFLIANAKGSSNKYPKNITRTKNYVGRSFYSGNPDADANFDELKIFSRALNQSEIKYEMNNQICAFNNTFIECSDNPSFIKTFGLQNYWPFCNSLKDVITNTDLYGGANYLLTHDRYNTTQSSLSLINGYLNMPPGVYFNSNFAVMAWVNVRSFNWYSRLLDVGNGARSDNVILSLSSENSGFPTSAIFFNSTDIISFASKSSQALILNKWHHLAFVYQMPTMLIYIDGIQVDTWTSPYGSGAFPKNITRTKNFIGRSNWYPTSKDKDADAAIDELKIFSRDLSQSEIQIEMENEIYSKFDASNCVINQNYTQTESLSFYWPFCSSLTDVVSSVSFYGGINNSFTCDRFNQNSSSINLENGYLNLPEGVYISGDHTVMAWIKLRNFNINSRLLDIGNADRTDNLAYAISAALTGIPFYSSFSNSNQSFNVFSSQQLKLNQWTHLTFVYENFTSFIFIDGIQICNLTSSYNLIPKNTTRSVNYLGRSSSYGLPGKLDQMADVIIDELKIFSSALSPKDIVDEMSNEIYSTNITKMIIANSNQNANCNLNKNFSKALTLQNYWPFCSNLSDVIGGADLFDGRNYKLIYDRFNYPMQSLSLTNGFLQIPKGVYFNGSSFTVMLWFFQIQQLFNLTILDFSNGPQKDNIAFTLLRNNEGPCVEVYNSTGQMISSFQMTKRISFKNEWQHLAFVYNSSGDGMGTIYLNGQNVFQKLNVNITQTNSIRENNFIGRSNWGPTYFPHPFINYDEIKIFNSALNQSEVKYEMNNQIFN